MSSCHQGRGYVADVPIDPSQLVPRPAVGRVFEGARKVRLGDVDPSGRLRLDSAVRYLQDLSADDTADTALPDAEAWVVRKTVLEVHRFPRYLESLQLATWCAGIGSHYAERRVSIVGQRGRIEGATTWVCVDMATGRPRRIPPGFEEMYGEASGGRRIKARLVHPDANPDADRSPWSVRWADLDVLDHVNNAAYWSAVEETRALVGGQLRAPLRAEVEHHRALRYGEPSERVVSTSGGRLSVWVVVGASVTASAVVVPI